MGSISDVEIFGVGKWNGIAITESMLDNIVDAFEATKSFALPVLKLGHAKNQKLLQEDGLPAAGWITRLYRKGQKLFADFEDIPDKIHKLIDKKAYRKVSAEIFHGYKFEGKTYPHLLGAVALLGADVPAVRNLNDILNQYSQSLKSFQFTNENDTIKSELFTIVNEENPEVLHMPPDDQEDLKKQLAETKRQIDEMATTVQSFKKEREDREKEFSEYKKQSEKKILDLQARASESEIESFTLDLEKKDLIAPSMKPFVTALLKADGISNAEFSIKDKDDKEKKIDAKTLITDLLGLAKQIFAINTEARTQNGNPKEQADSKFEDEQNAMEEKIQDYMAKNPKASYREAYTFCHRKLA